MSIELMSVQALRDNVAMSRGHVDKQIAIITRFRELQSKALADQASALLVTMHEHLALEIELLARREAQEAGKQP